MAGRASTGGGLSEKTAPSEFPLGHKPAAQITDKIGRFRLANVLARIEPLGCVMAGEQEPWWKRKDVLSPKQIRQIAHRAERRTNKKNIRGGNGDPDAEEASGGLGFGTK